MTASEVCICLLVGHRSSQIWICETILRKAQQATVPNLLELTSMIVLLSLTPSMDEDYPFPNHLLEMV